MDIDLHGPWKPRKHLQKGNEQGTAIKASQGKKNLKQRAKELATEDENKGQFLPTKDRRMIRAN
jgi:hypothetical protein